MISKKYFHLIPAIICFSGSMALAQTNNIENKIAELENKIQALEKAFEKTQEPKSQQCRLQYQSYGYRLNTCPTGSFVKSITDVGGNSLQLECGGYSLTCF